MASKALNRAYAAVATAGAATTMALGAAVDGHSVPSDLLAVGERTRLFIEEPNGDYEVGLWERVAGGNMQQIEVEETRVGGVINNTNPVGITRTANAKAFSTITQGMLDEYLLREGGTITGDLTLSKPDAVLNVGTNRGEVGIGVNAIIDDGTNMLFDAVRSVLINSSVGIGEGAPVGVALHVKGDVISLEESAAGRQLQFIPPSVGVDATIRSSFTQAGFRVQNNPSGDNATFDDLMVINGVTKATNLFGDLSLVDGAAERFSVNTSGVVDWNPSGIGGQLTWDTGRAIVKSNGSNDLALQAGATEFLRGVGTDALFGGNITLSGTQIRRSNDTSQLFLSAGSTVATGANIVLNGTGAANANDILFRTSANPRGMWNDSAAEWQWQGTTHTGIASLTASGTIAGNNVVVNGRLGVGAAVQTSWSTGWDSIDFGGATSLMSNNSAASYLQGINWLWNGTNYVRKLDGAASRLVMNPTNITFDLADTGLAGAAITWQNAFSIDSNLDLTLAGNIAAGGGTFGGNVDGRDAFFRNSSGGRVVLDDTDVLDASRPMAYLQSSSGVFSLGSANRHGSGGTTGSTEYFTLDLTNGKSQFGGDVGIGVSPSTHRLEVHSDGDASIFKMSRFSGSGWMEMVRDTTRMAYFGWEAAGGGIATNSAADSVVLRGTAGPVHILGGVSNADYGLTVAAGLITLGRDTQINGQLVANNAVAASAGIGSNVGTDPVTFMDFSSGTHRIGAYSYGAGAWQDLHINSSAIVVRPGTGGVDFAGNVDIEGVGGGSTGALNILLATANARTHFAYGSTEDNYITRGDTGITRFRPASGGTDLTLSATGADFHGNNIANAGHIGIDKTPRTDFASAYKALQVGAHGYVMGVNSGIGLWTGTNFYFDGSNYRYSGTGAATQYYMNDSGKHIFRVAPSGNSGDVLTWQTAMEITQDLGVDIAGEVFINPSIASHNALTVRGPASHTGNLQQWQNSAGTNLALVASNGDFQNQNNSYGGISDRALKRDLLPAKPQWDDVKFLSEALCNYRLKSAVSDNADAPWHLGVIAQEIQERCPGLVEHVGGHLSVKYSIIQLKALKALGEAMSRIETLEAEVNQLKAA